MNITKLDLCSRVSKKMEIPQTELKPIFEHFLEEILSVLAEGNRIELRGFGVFKVKTRKQRIGRNPRTGEQVTISSYLAPSFKFSKDGQKIFDQKLQNGLPKKVTKAQTRIPESTPAYSSKTSVQKATSTVQKTHSPKTVEIPKVAVKSADSFSPI